MTGPLPATSPETEWAAFPRGLTDRRDTELPMIDADVRLRYNDVSTALIGLPFTPQAWTQVARGTRLEIRRHRRTTLIGTVTDRELVVDDEHPDGAISVAVESDEALLADRLCFPNPGLPFLSQSNGSTYRQTAPGETVAKDLVRLNAGPSAITERRVVNLTVEPDQARGITYLTILRYANLLTTLQVLGRDWGPFGFRVEPTAAGGVFRVFTPPDLSGTVRFSVGVGNLDGLAYREAAPTVTYAMSEGIVPAVMGTATDSQGRQYEYVITPEQRLRYAETTTDPASLEFGRRAESWTDAGDSIAGVSDLRVPVRDALGAGRAAVGLELNPSGDLLLDADPAVLLGARVTVQVGPEGYTDTIEVVDVVREVQMKYSRDDGTDDVVPVVGSDGATASILVPQLGGIDRRLSLLERR